MGFMVANSPAKKPWNTGYIGKRNKIQKTFDCVFCEPDQSVEVKIHRKEKVGTLFCRKCKQAFECEITHLDAEVDVHGKWIDACEEAARQEVANAEEEARVKSGRTEKYMKPTLIATKPVVKQITTTAGAVKPPTNKRKLDNDAPEPITKRSKPSDIPIEKSATNLTQRPPIQLALEQPRAKTLIGNDSRVKADWELAIEQNRAGRTEAVKAEARKKAALAKERRDSKAKEWAKFELEEFRRWRAVTAAAVVAANVMMKKRVEDALLEAATKEEEAKRTKERAVVVTSTGADRATGVSNRSHDSLFGSSSDSSANSMFNVPTPQGSIESSIGYAEYAAIPTINVECIETTEEIRRGSDDSLFGSSPQR